MARMYDPISRKWCDAPYGIACKCTSQFNWPEKATSIAELGSVEVEMRISGGFNTYNIVKSVLLERLVLASDWILSRHANGLTVRGCPVSIGSPLAVGVQASSSAIFFAGSVMEMELPKPELYKRGKGKVSVLVIGFYCSKKKYDLPGAVYHVSDCICPQSLLAHAGHSSRWLESKPCSEVGRVDGALVFSGCFEA